MLPSAVVVHVYQKSLDIPNPIGEQFQNAGLLMRNGIHNINGGIHGDQQWGVCSVLITPAYSDNDVSQIFNFHKPTLVLGGQGGRYENKQGQHVQACNQAIGSNSSLFLNCEFNIPLRLCMTSPWKNKVESVMYMGLWKVLYMNYMPSNRINDTLGYKVFRWYLEPYNLQEYQNWLKQSDNL